MTYRLQRRRPCTSISMTYRLQRQRPCTSISMSYWDGGLVQVSQWRTGQRWRPCTYIPMRYRAEGLVRVIVFHGLLDSQDMDLQIWWKVSWSVNASSFSTLETNMQSHHDVCCQNSVDQDKSVCITIILSLPSLIVLARTFSLIDAGQWVTAKLWRPAEIVSNQNCTLYA